MKIEIEFYIVMVNSISLIITLVPVNDNVITEGVVSRIGEIIQSKEKILISLPKRPKIKMTLKEVCKELGKDIEIVDYGEVPIGYDEY